MDYCACWKHSSGKCSCDDQFYVRTVKRDTFTCTKNIDFRWNVQNKENGLWENCLGCERTIIMGALASQIFLSDEDQSMQNFPRRHLPQSVWCYDSQTIMAGSWTRVEWRTCDFFLTIPGQLTHKCAREMSHLSRSLYIQGRPSKVIKIHSKFQDLNTDLQMLTSPNPTLLNIVSVETGIIFHPLSTHLRHGSYGLIQTPIEHTLSEYILLV